MSDAFFCWKVKVNNFFIRTTTMYSRVSKKKLYISCIQKGLVGPVRIDISGNVENRVALFAF